MATKINTIDDYINTFPENTQEVLKSIRETIRKAVPKAEEAITYDMPTFKLKGKNLVHFSVWKNHIGMYPQPEGTKTFQEELAPYKAGTSTVQFPLDRPIPYDLVSKIASFLAREMPEEEHYRRVTEKPLEKTPARAKAAPEIKTQAKAKPKTPAKQKMAVKQKADVKKTTAVKRKTAVKPKTVVKAKAAVKPKAAAGPEAAAGQSKAGIKTLKRGGKSWKQKNKKSPQTYGSTGRRKKQRSSTPASLKTQKSARKSAPPKRATKSTASRKGR